jgi:RHS repeat-associated protein
MRSMTFTGTGTSTGSSDISYSLSYDQNGNLTQKQNQLDPNDKTTYAWDANNRLIQMNQSKTINSNTGTGSAGTTGTSTSTSSTVLSASFSYDAFGRRIQSTITQGSQAPNTVQYLYEGAQALGEIRDGKLSHRLLTGLSLDETIARIAINADGNKDAANSRLYLTDALNSVIAQLADDDNANIQNSYAYSPYGQSQTVGPDSANNPNQYTSRENDNTGLYYYRARYYDPVLKRFVSSDPIGLAGGINTFAYVEGNPLSFTDPDGLQRMPGYTRPNNARDAAGYHDPRGNFVCEQWNCPANPGACSRNDLKRPSDFLPAATSTNAADAPIGCRCTQLGYRRDWSPPMSDERDLVDAYNNYKEAKPMFPRFKNATGGLPSWYRIGGYGR